MATIACTVRWHSDEVYRHGRSFISARAFLLPFLLSGFPVNYIHEAGKLEVKKQIVDMTSNGSGVRDTARVLMLISTPSFAP